MEESQGGHEAVSQYSGRMPILSMPHRRSQATVTQFLRDALAVDELGVAELEARARATGLLGDGSPSRDFFGETASQKTPDTGLTSIRVAKLGTPNQAALRDR